MNLMVLIGFNYLETPWKTDQFVRERKKKMKKTFLKERDKKMMVVKGKKRLIHVFEQ